MPARRRSDARSGAGESRTATRSRRPATPRPPRPGGGPPGAGRTGRRSIVRSRWDDAVVKSLRRNMRRRASLRADAGRMGSLGPGRIRLPVGPAADRAEHRVEDAGVRHRLHPVPAPAARVPVPAARTGPGTTSRTEGARPGTTSRTEGARLGRTSRTEGARGGLPSANLIFNSHLELNLSAPAFFWPAHWIRGINDFMG
jgi:hypothetical protein